MAADSPPNATIKPWTSGIAPSFIGLFLWVAYYDQFGRVTLGKSADGLRWPALGAVAGGLIAYLFFFYPPAIRGLRTRKGFSALAESPFGVRGARWLSGPAIGLANVGWFAVGTFYATDFTLRGLVALRLLEPGHLATVNRGVWEMGGPLFLGTALLWGLAFAFVGQFAVRLVAAIMNVFPIFPALVLAAATARALYDLPPARLAPGQDSAAYLAFAAAAQLVLAFFSGSAPLAADWGASSRDARDVRFGGLVGVACSAIILAVLGLLIVSGRPDRSLNVEEAPARRRIDERTRPGVPFRQLRPIQPRNPQAPPQAAIQKVPTVGDVLQLGIGGAAGGAMLLVLAIGSMAPAVYAASSFGKAFSQTSPRISRTAWTLIGTALAFPLIALRVPANEGPLFDVLGAIVSPLLGTFAAELARRPRFWPGPRPGWNRAGAVAWLVGLVVGLAPVAGRISGSDRLASVQPAAFFAFLAAFVVYFVGARFAPTPSAEVGSGPDLPAADSPPVPAP